MCLSILLKGSCLALKPASSDKDFVFSKGEIWCSKKSHIEQISWGTNMNTSENVWMQNKSQHTQCPSHHVQRHTGNWVFISILDGPASKRHIDCAGVDESRDAPLRTDYNHQPKLNIQHTLILAIIAYFKLHLLLIPNLFCPLSHFFPLILSMHYLSFVRKIHTWCCLWIWPHVGILEDLIIYMSVLMPSS